VAGAIAWITTTSGFAVFVRAKLFVDGDAAATAHNILAHDRLLRLAFAGDMIATLYIAYALLLYDLFRPVNRGLSLVAVCFGLVGCAVGTLNALFELAPLVILENARPFGAFSVEQLQALALLFVNLHAHGTSIGMVLFGFYNLFIGSLMVKSTFFPRVLGALLAISGLCYLVGCFANFISPSWAAHLFPYILIPGVAELLVALWLVLFGVNEQQWHEQSTKVTGRA
jgi:hypothetical protein